jgi:(p)ppGpp synthase/HD superfamily hydrolase
MVAVVGSLVVSSKGKNKIEQNCTKQKKEKNPQSGPSSYAIQFQYVFQHVGVVWFFSL